MLCQKCKKYEATAHISKSVNGQGFEAWLCPRCAADIFPGKNIGGETGSAGDAMFQGLYGDFGIGNFFEGFFNKSAPPVSGKHCDFCGSAFSDIARSGKAGCYQCYSVFAEELRPTLQKLHGSASYEGALPESASIEAKKARQVSELKARMQEAIDRQAFETAAKLRDELKNLEQS